MNRHTAKTKAMRAIAAEILQKFIILPLKAMLIILLVLLIISLYLSIDKSAWWLLAASVSALWTITLTLIVAIAKASVKKIYPRPLLKNEKIKIQKFIKHISSSYLSSTGKAVGPVRLTFIIMWQIAKRNRHSFIESIIKKPLREASELKDEFTEICNMFIYRQ